MQSEIGLEKQSQRGHSYHGKLDGGFQLEVRVRGCATAGTHDTPPDSRRPPFIPKLFTTARTSLIVFLETPGARQP